MRSTFPGTKPIREWDEPIKMAGRNELAVMKKKITLGSSSRLLAGPMTLFESGCNGNVHSVIITGIDVSELLISVLLCWGRHEV
ncbi:hypothetical protein RRG08_062762 [Elysia crispata]|uniref:Uncharacterized protein n=1 Tax=Elysia crispata TaxID=231223 RepID=A0AAE1E8E9_9GAST|nr:hypothetical protein RRG08_062762 [Elysia crispata]